MYDFTYKLTYNESDDDDVYRKELLDVFFLKEYNGDKIKSLQGYYLFADYCTGRIWAFKYINQQSSTNYQAR